MLPKLKRSLSGKNKASLTKRDYGMHNMSHTLLWSHCLVIIDHLSG